MTLTINEPDLAGSVDMELAALCEFTTWVLLGGTTESIEPCEQEAEYLVRLKCLGCGVKTRLACTEDALAIARADSLLACKACRRTDAFYISHVAI